MLKPILDIVSDLKEQLFLIPGIVNQLQKKENSALENFYQWLQKSEEILQKKGYAQCSELAGLRSKLISSDFSNERRTVKKKNKFFIASEIIYDSQSVVLQLITPMEERIGEARLIIKQILLVLKPTGILVYEPSINFNNFVQGIWHLLQSNEQVGGGISKVLTLVNQADALRILAEEIDVS